MNQKEAGFVAGVWRFYGEQGRHDLPWRQTRDPYCILVSELMLQQTQVARVIPKYTAFVTSYPTVQKLAKASLGDVLRLWQGLGYNRRAKYLLQCAQYVTNELSGVFPNDRVALEKLPGIGPYTAAAICAFAYNQPVELIETNVRQVYIHHFFKSKKEVTDKEILTKVEKTIPRDRAGEWYSAVMDYGTHLKSVHGNNTRKVKGYTKQSIFKGSDREVRGAILRCLAENSGSRTQLRKQLAELDIKKIDAQLEQLLKDEMILFTNKRYRLP